MAPKKDSLKKYHSKRTFSETPEPKGKIKIKKTKKAIFVVQKHNAHALHYDFRLEIDGVLKSWAIPKGPSMDNEIKRLAVETEDHPMDYAKFEGIIPKGQYGGGTVMVWDYGTYENIKKEKNGEIKPISKCYKDGQIEVLLNGKKLKGGFVLIRTHYREGDKNWIFKKIKDKNSSEKDILKKDKSVLTNRTTEQIAKENSDDDPEMLVGKFKVNITNPDKILFPKDKITKSDLVNYYNKIGSIMLHYTKDHPLTMLRFPQGIHQQGFYHKDAPDFFPDWIKKISVERKEEKGKVHYVVANNVATLVYLANYGCITPHLWLSKVDKLDYPDRMIFDLDPSDEKSFKILKETAKKLKKILEDIGLHPFVMTTGSRGLHITTPIKRTHTFDEVKKFAQDIAQIAIQDDPENLTMQVRKEKRGKKIFIDTLRNDFGATAVAPYAIRAIDKAPIATPLKWKELDDPKLTSQKYNISNIFKRINKIGDPWQGFDKYAASIKNAQRLLKKDKKQSKLN